MRATGSKMAEPFLYTAKTQVPVYCPLPDFAIEVLESCPGTHPDYYFWTGASKIKSAIGDWQRSLRKLFAIAGIDGGHAHRFRDTFAVELLLKGVPLERVSVLLGHRSVKVTEKHYAPWVRARQEQMEADVKRTWSEDPIIFAETKGYVSGTREKQSRQLVENKLDRVVEAAGVEPASEEVHRREPTYVVRWKSQPVLSSGRLRTGPARLNVSLGLRTEACGPSRHVTSGTPMRA